MRTERLKKARRLLLLIGILAVQGRGSEAWAAEDPVFLVLGRPTLPDEQAAVASTINYTASNVDPKKDTVRYETKLRYGLLDGLTLQAGVSSAPKPRDQFKIDDANFGVLASLWHGPIDISMKLQATQVLDASNLPSLNGDLLLVKDLDSWLFMFTLDESVRRGRKTHKIKAPTPDGRILAGWRPSLQSLIAIEAQSNGSDLYLATTLGGFLGGPIFLGLEPRLGLSHNTTHFSLSLAIEVLL